MQSLRSFSPEFEQVVWHFGDFALPSPIGNVVLRDANRLLIATERRAGYCESDVVLTLVKMRILYRYGGWMCDPDVLWLGRYCEVPSVAKPLAVVASVITRGETNISACFMAGAQYADFWKLCELKVGGILRNGGIFAGLDECIRHVQLQAPFDLVILEPEKLCPIAPEWRAAREDDPALDHPLACAVKVWPEWPEASALVVIARSLRRRDASRATSLARKSSDVVELLCATRTIIRDAQHSLDCIIGDTSSALECVSLALKLLYSLHHDELAMSLSWGPRFLACGVMELAFGRATFGAPSEFGVAAPFLDRSAIRSDLLGNAGDTCFIEYQSLCLSKVVRSIKTYVCEGVYTRACARWGVGMKVRKRPCLHVYGCACVSDHCPSLFLGFVFVASAQRRHGARRARRVHV